MSERPTAQELTEALLEFLGGEILPLMTDHRLRFRTLVAMNALSIARRELESREQFPDEDELREQARRIRAGASADLAELTVHRLTAAGGGDTSSGVGVGLLPPEPLYLRRPDAVEPGARKPVSQPALR